MVVMEIPIVFAAKINMWSIMYVRRVQGAQKDQQVMTPAG
jgi:hypothetical protein